MKILINKQQTPIKNRLSTLVLLALLGLGSSLVVSQTQPLASAQSQSLDQILVIVDDDVVLASELEQRLKQILINIKKSGKTGPRAFRGEAELLCAQRLLYRLEWRQFLRAVQFQWQYS